MGKACLAPEALHVPLEVQETAGDPAGRESQLKNPGVLRASEGELALHRGSLLCPQHNPGLPSLQVITPRWYQPRSLSDVRFFLSSPLWVSDPTSEMKRLYLPQSEPLRMSILSVTEKGGYLKGRN